MSNILNYCTVVYVFLLESIIIILCCEPNIIQYTTIISILSSITFKQMNNILFVYLHIKRMIIYADDKQ